MAGKDFGGRMSVRLSSGSTLALRGTFNVSGARSSSEATTNQDGSMDRVFTPRSPSAVINFRDGDVTDDELIESPRQNIVINEENTGVTHHFIDAVFTGTPENNRVNGEASGVTIVGTTYRRTGG